MTRALRFALPLALLATPGLADPAKGEGSFLAGLSHPFLGLDHVLAMVAAGA